MSASGRRSLSRTRTGSSRAAAGSRIHAITRNISNSFVMRRRRPCLRPCEPILMWRIASTRIEAHIEGLEILIPPFVVGDFVRVVFVRKIASRAKRQHFQEEPVDTIRVAVIGLGWFGEIHCDAIIGVPNLKLAALCTRTPERLKAMAAKFGVRKTTPDYRDLLADPEIDAVSIVTMWGQHTEPPSPPSKLASTSFSRSRWRRPSKIAVRSWEPPHDRRESCRSATSDASTRATAWPSRRSPRARLARSSR
jgi:Oxidoreductase family, NAD-binding Rossmann fold